MSGLQVPAPPYVGPPANFTPGDNKPIKRIVIHSAVCPCGKGWARKIARLFSTGAVKGSAHYVVDPYETVQAAYDSVICWHAPPNGGSLGVEMTDYPGPVPDDKPWTAAYKAARRAWRWRKAEQKLMLQQTAKLVGQLCAYYRVPPEYVGVRGLKAGKRGVTTHNAVSSAFKQSTHWDPGFWPRRRFMKMVRQEYRRVRAEAARG